MGKLDGKVAMITGGARGQGRSHAVTFAREGADVVVCDIAKPIDSVGYRLGSAADLEETVRQVEATGRRCLAISADVRSQSDMDAVAEQAIGELGSIDVLVANAGIVSYVPIVEMSEATWQDMLDVNLTGVYHTLRAVVPHMIERRTGRIVAISSLVARMGMAAAGHYAAAKWGVIGLAKSLSLEVAPYGITVNVVLPGGVNTEIVHNPVTYKMLLPDVENPKREDVMPLFERRVPTPGLLEPEEVSAAVLFLVSDDGRHLSGETITMSGGMSAGIP